MVITNTQDVTTSFSISNQNVVPIDLKNFRNTKIQCVFDYDTTDIKNLNGVLKIIFLFPSGSRPPFIEVHVLDMMTQEEKIYKAFKDSTLYFKGTASNFRITIIYKDIQVQREVHFWNAWNIKTSKYIFDPFLKYLDLDITTDSTDQGKILFDSINRFKEISLYYNTDMSTFPEDYNELSFFYFDKIFPQYDLKVLRYQFSSFGNEISFDKIQSKYLLKNTPLKFSNDKMAYVKVKDGLKTFEVLNNKDYLFNFYRDMFQRILSICKSENIDQQDYHLLFKNPLSRYISGTFNDDIVIHVYNLGGPKYERFEIF